MEESLYRKGKYKHMENGEVEMNECMENEIMQQDLEMLVDSDLPITALEGKSVLVTGATGLIGSQMVYLLACYNRMRNLQIHIIAMVRNEEKGKKMFSHLIGRGDVELLVGDINRPVVYSDSVDYNIHGASATSSKYFVSNPVETIYTALDGTSNILKFATEKKINGMVYLSSLEVYGTPEKDADLITENDYGYIEPLSVRSSYSEGKRMVECLCASYAKEYDVPVKVARLSQTFGAGVAYDDGRVFAEFARCAIEGKNIVLHTEGKTVRTYCYTIDAVTALLTVLAKGQAGEAYNVTNMDTAISIYDMAKLVSGILPESNIAVERDIPEDLASFGYNPEMIVKLDSTKLQKLGWKATVGLREMYERLIESMSLVH